MLHHTLHVTPNFFFLLLKILPNAAHSHFYKGSVASPCAGSFGCPSPRLLTTGWVVGGVWGTADCVSRWA